MSNLSLFTIYDHPSDYPEGYVVREWQVWGGLDPAPGAAEYAATLDAARRLIPPGFVRLGRTPDDDPTIVESWL